MTDEVTRASSEDRERYVNHLPDLYARGFISREQVDTITGQLLKATHLADLDALLDGMPKPALPRRPRDWGIPANFIPACAVASLFGLTLAVVPAVALSGQHGLAAGFSAVCILWGAWITFIAVVVAICAWCSWDSLSGDEQRARRRKDTRGR